MKQLTTSVLLKVLVIGLLFSCGETNKKEAQSESNTLETATTTQTKEAPKTNKGTLLCKVNGEDWYYTASNGLVSENSKTKVRTAIIGFTRQLDNGKESIQVEYDVKKNALKNIWIQLKRPNKEGQLITAFYTQYGDKLHLKPEASMSGTVSLNESSRKASGTATFTIANDYEQKQLANATDLMVTVTDFSFTEVDYSDTDDLKKLITKNQ